MCTQAKVAPSPTDVRDMSEKAKLCESGTVGAFDRLERLEHYDLIDVRPICVERWQKGSTMTTRTPTEAEPLLTPAEVATMFRVDPKTVTRWAKAGKLTSIRTLGGHRRYKESEVRSLLTGGADAQTTEEVSG